MGRGLSQGRCLRVRPHIPRRAGATAAQVFNTQVAPLMADSTVQCRTIALSFLCAPCLSALFDVFAQLGVSDAAQLRACAIGLLQRILFQHQPYPGADRVRPLRSLPRAHRGV